MKRFVFPLEKALEIREIRKLLAEEKLGEAQREESRTRQRLAAAEGMREECFDGIRASLGGRVDPAEMRHLMKLRTSIEDEIWREKMDLVKRESATREATEVVVKRTQEEQTLVQHRENQLEEYMALYWWEQGKALDEMGSQRYSRSRGGEN
ncbi:MAG: flagellar export protein FliJ [Bacillota bacterium]